MNGLSSKIVKANIMAAAALLVANSADAQVMTAKVVMEKMSHEERFSYIHGIAEGMAYARFRKDTLATGKKTSAGAACIRTWIYSKAPDGKKVYSHIEANFVRYPTYMPSEIIATMAKKQCGE